MVHIPEIMPTPSTEETLVHTQSGHRTAAGAPGDLFYIETSLHHPPREMEWLLAYVDGKNAFVASRLADSRHFQEQGKHAEAAVAARIALDVPHRGDFGWGRHRISHCAAIIENDRWFGDPPEESDEQSPYNKVFSIPLHIQEELEDAQFSQRVRTYLSGDPSAYTEAIDAFARAGDQHAAGVAAIELAEFFTQNKHIEAARTSYFMASRLIELAITEIAREPKDATHAAIIDSLGDHFRESLSGYIELSLPPHSIDMAEREVLKQVAYDYQDTNGYWDKSGKLETLVEVMGLLRDTSVTVKERRFFRRETRALAAELELRNYFAQVSSIRVGGASPTPNPIHRRP